MIIRSIINLAASLGMETTAEGVESQNQLEKLRDEGCTYAQGFLLSQAVHPSKLIFSVDYRFKQARHYSHH